MLKQMAAICCMLVLMLCEWGHGICTWRGPWKVRVVRCGRRRAGYWLAVCGVLLMPWIADSVVGLRLNRGMCLIQDIVEGVIVLSAMWKAIEVRRWRRKAKARARKAHKSKARGIWMGIVSRRRCCYRMRGGYGLNAQHRYLKAGVVAGMTREERQKQIKMVILGVRKLYDPAGDGLCWWYCIAEALKGRRKNSYERIRDALEIQRRVMDAVDREARRGAAGIAEILMHVSDACGSRYSSEQFWSDMAHLRSNP
jgi:hypothetical protein